MSEISSNVVSRRELLKTTGQVAAASIFAASALPGAHAAENNTIQIVLIGCGGRGGGAIANALRTKQGPTKLIAMADVFPEKLNTAYSNTKTAFPDQVDVPEDHKFIGFDGYKKAMDLLKPGDVVILTTPVVFRWVHFSYAISKGLNVFMEKPTTVDGPTSRKMLELSAESVKKNLKVGVGLMCRHCKSRGELARRIKEGEIGDLTLLRAYRIAGPTGSASVGPKPEGMSELAYQIKNFHGFLWLSGGGFSDFLIHNIDECCWMKDAFPVEAKGHGGRHFRGDQVDQNFDTYNIEYTFADGTKMFMAGRTMPGCHQEFATFVHGTKGSAVVSQSGHHPSKARMYKSHRMVKEDLIWECPKPEADPYQLEWDDLMTAIRTDTPYNEGERGAKSSLVTAMGRMACHTGQVVTYEDMLNCEHEFAPNADKLTLDGPSPLMADANGKYPVPMPGINTRREY
ncbi:MAG: Gfo/Idh/MocA family protein [Planctomycetaceae bacterium]